MNNQNCNIESIKEVLQNAKMVSNHGKYQIYDKDINAREENLDND